MEKQMPSLTRNNVLERQRSEGSQFKSPSVKAKVDDLKSFFSLQNKDQESNVASGIGSRFQSKSALRHSHLFDTGNASPLGAAANATYN